MKHKLNFNIISMSIAHVVLLLVIASLLVLSAGFQRDGPTVESVDYIKEARASVNGGPWQDITLPHTFNDLPPRTPVTIETDIYPHYEDGVYIKIVYSPAEVFLNGKKVFEFGKRENYPAFMKDPATEIHIIEAYGTGDKMDLRIKYQSPYVRKNLVVHPPMVGTAKELIMERSRVLGIPIIFSMAQIVGGISLILISLCIMFVEKEGILFLYLGLFSLSTGAWAFGENNFSGVIFRHSTFLYLLSFIGLFTLIVPLLGFTRTIINFKNPKLIMSMELFYSGAAGIALILQLFGIVSCAQSMYFFHLTIPPALLILTIMTTMEYIKYQNIGAKRLILPMSVLTATAVLELVNYKFKFTYIFSSIFQMGILFFLLVMGVIAGLFIKDSIDLKAKQKELDFEKGLMDIRMRGQNNQTKLILEKEMLLKQQRHDLKHHLNVLREMAESGNGDLIEYLDDLIERIPKKTEKFCENNAVNAIISHYNSICANEDIEITMHLEVPEGNPNITDGELCSVFGNLLENAVEACLRMESGKRFIKINSSVHYDYLTITEDNSFDGKYKIKNNRFLSSKRDSFGIGTSSIKSTAEKADGNAQFETKDKVFLSSVYLKL